MNRKRLLVLFFLMIVGVGVFLSLKTEPPFPKNIVQLPVSFFPFEDRPLVEIRIGNRKYSLLVDLGSSHTIDLRSSALQRIAEKEELGISPYIGIRGKEYPVRAFKLPPLKFDQLEVQGVTGYEESLDFIRDAKTWEDEGFLCHFKSWLDEKTQDGRIGWTFFSKFPCLFDFPHGKIAFGKDFPSLAKASGYAREEFVKLPFSIGDWGIIFSLPTDAGVRTFLLDTGCTSSLLKPSLFQIEGEEKVELILELGEGNQCPWKFTPFEFTDRVGTDGILGVDFFKRHTLLFDFSKSIAYVKPQD